MNTRESFNTLAYEEEMHVEEGELLAFFRAVAESFGPEQAWLSVHDWLDESDLLDGPPLSMNRNWRAVTVAASARLANRESAAGRRVGLVASPETRVLPTSSLNCFANVLRA